MKIKFGYMMKPIPKPENRNKPLYIYYIFRSKPDLKTPIDISKKKRNNYLWLKLIDFQQELRFRRANSTHYIDSSRLNLFNIGPE